MREVCENPESRRAVRECLRNVLEEVRGCLVRHDVMSEEKQNFREELRRVILNPFYQEYGDPD